MRNLGRTGDEEQRKRDEKQTQIGGIQKFLISRIVQVQNTGIYADPARTSHAGQLSNHVYNLHCIWA